MSSPQPQRICRVQDTFLIKGRGLILAPDAPLPDGVFIRVGNAVTVRRPDGRIIETHIRGIEMSTPNPDRIVPFMLDPAFSKDDIPIGSEIWTRPQSAHSSA